MRLLAGSSAIDEIVAAVLGPGAIPVRGILFDKTSAANWKVPWHQDVTIAVAERLEVDGYGPWSLKDGVTHVQPPESVLERMVTVRIHLDDCPEENGALKVITGSHRRGKIPERKIAGIVADGEVRVCEARAGGVLVMRPLLVHSSSAAEVPGHRRVLHFDFAAGELHGGMKWAVGQAKEIECESFMRPVGSS
jgi:ectoine hydroxylase-related dioxygenase (phytanoyl-CoA dioxygenase family)